jgi:TRAP-type C4-dicarboxylate transport system substrate-binding protein
MFFSIRLRMSSPSFARRTAWLAATLVGLATSQAGATDKINLPLVGGLAGVTQYKTLEEPFWREEFPKLSNGRVVPTINPFDRSGIRGQDMLALMRIGVVPFGTLLLAAVSGDEPLLAGVDLPAVNPSFDTLRQTARLYRPQIEKLLSERYGIEMLGLYTYPAQVVFCTKPFASLSDLAGRKVRTSSLAQSELMSGIGAIPVITPFAEIMPSLQRGVVDCAITGSLSGYDIGLHQTTSHLHTMAINWGLTVFGANKAAIEALPEDIRSLIRTGVATLEQRIWDAGERDTLLGFACNSGSADCTRPSAGKMKIVTPGSDDDALRRRLLSEVVLPAWIDRCGIDCAVAWNESVGPALGLLVDADGMARRPAH